MDNTLQLNSDRIRKNTADKVNRKIDKHTDENIQRYATQGYSAIKARIKELGEEWDTEQYLELTSGLNILIGLGLALTVNKRWLLLSAISAAFLVQHSIQGWCPPLPLFRQFGVRTRHEIDKERNALQERLQD